MANAVIYNAVKKKLGFDRCKAFFTAAAPMSKSTLDYFCSLGIPILEIYGSSETTGPVTVSTRDYYRLGSSGMVFPGVEGAIAEPLDENEAGEVLSRGRNIFLGYLNNEAKSREALDPEGYYHSGDVGKFDADGYLYITGRIKEILVTAGGENVAPVLIEDKLKEEMPFVSNAMVVGDRKKYLTVLLSLKTVADLEKGGAPTSELTAECMDALKAVGCEATTVEEAMGNDKLKTAIANGIAAANVHAISRAARVQKGELIPVDFSVPGGELTPCVARSCEPPAPVLTLARQYVQDDAAEGCGQGAPCRPARARQRDAS